MDYEQNAEACRPQGREASECNDLLCPFCGGVVDPEGWLDGNGKRGPECEVCGATAPDMDTWNNRYTGKPDMSYQ